MASNGKRKIVYYVTYHNANFNYAYCDRLS